MKKFILILTLAAALVTGLFAEGIKIAYIDTDRVMAVSTDTQEAQQTLMAERTKWESEINEMDMEIQALMTDYEQKKLVLTEQGKIEAETKITELTQERQARVQELFGDQGTFMQKQNELLEPILTKLKAIIDRVSVEENYTVVLDAASGGILYAKSSLDITDKIIDEMNKTVETE